MSNTNATAPVPPHSLEAPAPAQPARPGIDIVFPLHKRPAGSPGKEGFCMKEVFNLDGREYMMVLNSIQEIAIACKLDMMKSITRQNQNILRRIYKKSAAKRKAAEAHIDTELGFQHAIEQVSQGLGEMSFKYDNKADQEMDYEHGPVFGDTFLDHVPLSAHELAQPPSPVPAPVCTLAVPPYVPPVPSAAALACRPPPIPSAAIRPRPRPHQAEDSLDSAAMSALTSMSAPTAPTAPSATSATSAPVGPANIIPAPLAALARLPPPIPPAASHPRPRLHQANGSSDLVPVPTPTPVPTPVPTPAPAPTPAPSPTSSPVPTPAPSVSAPDSLSHVVPALVPVATSTPVHARTSASPAAALTTAPLAICARVSNLLLSLGTPEVDRTLFNINDDNFDLTIEEPVVVVKGKGKAKGAKAKAGAETPKAEPSTSAQPAARASHCKKVVELPPTAPATRTCSKKAL
ncbi:hypothetical protein FRC10_006396 [Ceratobasidium sp. 414]|nr:hypothetical protein FRC10_006396 [Ceratobasidium sp. 414]